MELVGVIDTVCFDKKSLSNIREVLIIYKNNSDECYIKENDEKTGMVSWKYVGNIRELKKLNGFKFFKDLNVICDKDDFVSCDIPHGIYFKKDDMVVIGSADYIFAKKEEDFIYQESMSSFRVLEIIKILRGIGKITEALMIISAQDERYHEYDTDVMKFIRNGVHNYLEFEILEMLDNDGCLRVR